jgi:hypothetical protein
MSHRSRRHRRQPRTMQAPNPPAPESVPPNGGPSARGRSAWPAAAVGFGLILVCIALFTLNLTGRARLFWLSRDDYIRTELEVTDLSPGTGHSKSMVVGIVTATGEEIHSRHVPTELVEFDSPSDPTGTLMKPETARGKRIPSWFAQDHNSLINSARVHYVSEFGTLPSGTLILGTAAVNLAIFAAGASFVAIGIRRANARGIPTNQS